MGHPLKPLPFKALFLKRALTLSQNCRLRGARADTFGLLDRLAMFCTHRLVLADPHQAADGVAAVETEKRRSLRGASLVFADTAMDRHFLTPELRLLTLKFPTPTRATRARVGDLARTRALGQIFLRGFRSRGSIANKPYGGQMVPPFRRDNFHIEFSWAADTGGCSVQLFIWMA